MNITDELREYALSFVGGSICAKLDAIADRIGEDNKKQMTDAFTKGVIDGIDMAEHSTEYAKLPVDADGEVINIGDVVTAGFRTGPLVVDRMELSRADGNYMWYVALDTDKTCWNSPANLRHYHAPTVEDVLREFVTEFNRDDTELCDEEIIERFAAKLQLKAQ